MRAAWLDLVRLCTVDVRQALQEPSRPGSVVHLLPSMAWGGAERLACTMHRLAIEAGWRSRIDAPAVDTVRSGVAEETGERLHVARDDESTLRGWALAARDRVARERPDVVHAHLPFPDRLGAAILAARGRPFVATFQLLPDPQRYWSLDEVIGKRSDGVIRFLSRLPTRARFVAVSRGDFARLATLVPRRRLVHLPNAPPFARRQPRPAAPFAWPEGSVRLLSAGRLHAQKGYDRMLVALARTPARETAWHWLVAGAGPERDALEKAASEHGVRDRISFAPEQPASALYPQADLVLAPSHWEGMPLVPMEAIEAGTAVVASDIAAHRELFACARASVLPSDEGEWPRVLAGVIENANARASLRAAQVACVPAHSRQVMWSAYDKLYRPLAGA